jgi:hypothetical protein
VADRAGPVSPISPELTIGGSPAPRCGMARIGTVGADAASSIADRAPGAGRPDERDQPSDGVDCCWSKIGGGAADDRPRRGDEPPPAYGSTGAFEGGYWAGEYWAAG